MVDNKWKEAGYVTEPVAAGTDMKAEIRRMCKEKNAVIMAHYYTEGEIQDIADFVGDSLALAQQAAKTDADIIVCAAYISWARPTRYFAQKRRCWCPT